MRKSLEMKTKNSCLNKAEANETIFVLLARDAASPAAIQAWIAERIRLGLNKIDDSQITDAINNGIQMEQERKVIWKSGLYK